MLLFCDDKAKVPPGEPGVVVSTGVRGRESIVPTQETLVACDHDVAVKSSVTPSVVLRCDIPESIDQSFVSGKINVVLNDSVFQTSSPFRHNAMLARHLAEEFHEMPPVLMKFTDGGVDQRSTIESVKVAHICLFQELNLDMLILARCAPGHSWINPCERVMSILNLGLQNVALARSESDTQTEDLIKKCNSMAELRKKAEQ